MAEEVTIQYTTVGRHGRIETREKTFKNEGAMTKWAEKNADKVEIVRYSYPEAK